jgi:pyruvate-formate lyase-activating enzyme
MELLVCDSKNRIYPIKHLEPAGMEAGHFFRLDTKDLIKLPRGSQLFTLPDRRPVGYDPSSKSFVAPEEKLFAVGAFVSPGHTTTHSAAYMELDKPKLLPLFSYAAVAIHKGKYYTAAIKVDDDTRHDCTLIDIAKVKIGVKALRKKFPKNRLVRHLEDCALKYGCAGAQNFFLGKHEGPLPSSPYCNAVCLGCISYQPRKLCSETQPRIKFIPEPQEIAEIALFHMDRVKDTIVSFGQGCDGEPLIVGDVLVEAVKLIRAKRSDNMINVNTNGSRPDIVSRLFDAGLDSIRVSMNSARIEYYSRYYKPIGYAFHDVLASIKIAKKKGGFVSLNYLTMPGFTDTEPELAAVSKLIEKYHIDMIQWRNLNYDPMEYFKEIDIAVDRSDILGVRSMMQSLEKRFPKLIFGYFNPSRGKIRAVVD